MEAVEHPLWTGHGIASNVSRSQFIEWKVEGAVRCSLSEHTMPWPCSQPHFVLTLVAILVSRILRISELFQKWNKTEWFYGLPILPIAPYILVYFQLKPQSGSLAHAS